MREPVTLMAYRLAMSALTPVAPLLLLTRRARGKEDGRRLGERRGIPGQARPEGARLCELVAWGVPTYFPGVEPA